MTHRFDILTLFPEICRPYLDGSILGRAQRDGRVEYGLCNIRDFATDKHRTVDDSPYGGGQGMVMKPDPLVAAIEAVRRPGSRVILTSPRGQPLTQKKARELLAWDHLVLICGRYEGVDERVIECAVDEQISLGDFVLTGGELAALAVVDAVTRLLPGVLGNPASADEESFEQDGLLEHPHYTRPRVFRGLEVPEVLLSGDHSRIEDWRRTQALRYTAERRPDLLPEGHVENSTPDSSTTA